MPDALENGFAAAWNAVQRMGGEAINETPKNYDPSLGYTYKDDPSGAPAILNDGGFAGPVDWKNIRYDHLQMLQSITASAVSYLWKKNDKAVVVKVTGNMHDQKSCPWAPPSKRRGGGRMPDSHDYATHLNANCKQTTLGFNGCSQQVLP